ncbi:MAG: hypothetical protein AB1730_20645 [Myxococcota bacterium]|jgi:hypothetical protein
MPSQTFALEPNGPKRLTLSWSAFWKNFTVSLDGKQIGALTPDELKAGKDVPLPDGSTLYVHLRRGFGNTGLELSRNGQPLPGAANDPASMVKNAAYLLYFLAALNALLGAAAVAFNVEVLQVNGVGLFSIALGFVFAVCGFFTMQRSLAALITAIALYGLDAIATLFSAVTAGGQPGAGGIIMRVFFIIVLARGVTGLRALKAQAKSPAA